MSERPDPERTETEFKPLKPRQAAIVVGREATTLRNWMNGGLRLAANSRITPHRELTYPDLIRLFFVKQLTQIGISLDDAIMLTNKFYDELERATPDNKLTDVAFLGVTAGRTRAVAHFSSRPDIREQLNWPVTGFGGISVVIDFARLQWEVDLGIDGLARGWTEAEPIIHRRIITRDGEFSADDE